MGARSGDMHPERVRLPRGEGEIAVKYTYRDFISLKRRFTRGTFSNWTKGGTLNVWYAIFNTPRTRVCIPEYLLTAQTKSNLPPKPVEAE